MIRTALIALFLASALFAPWWVAAASALALMVCFRAYLSVLFGAVLMDTLYGAPVVSLASTAHLYTAMFLILILIVVLLRVRLMD